MVHNSDKRYNTCKCIFPVAKTLPSSSINIVKSPPQATSVLVVILEISLSGDLLPLSGCVSRFTITSVGIGTCLRSPLPDNRKFNNFNTILNYTQTQQHKILKNWKKKNLAKYLIGRRSSVPMSKPCLRCLQYTNDAILPISRKKWNITYIILNEVQKIVIKLKFIILSYALNVNKSTKTILNKNYFSNPVTLNILTFL